MPNYNGVWSLSTQFQNASGWPLPPALPIALFGAGNGSGSPYDDTIQQVNISTTGNATDFGDLLFTARDTGAVSSSIRAVFSAGRENGTTPGNSMNYVTIASAGNAIDFGDATVSLRNKVGCSNSTRGLFMGGANSSNTRQNTVDYITIASVGNAIDFGDLTSIVSNGSGSNSSTRGIHALGYTTAVTNTIEYLTIASTGNATDFGDATVARMTATNGVISSGTRGCFAGGDTSGSGRLNTIDYITIASTGNASDFGDLLAVVEGPYGASSTTRGLAAGGTNTATNVIQYITIASTGNATDFGDLLANNFQGSGCSAVHGGLS